MGLLTKGSGRQDSKKKTAIIALLSFFVILAITTRRHTPWRRQAVAASNPHKPTQHQGTDALDTRPSLTAGDFRGLFFLLVSLLHGSLFFSLTDNLLTRGEFTDPLFWTTTFLNLSVFFRVLQSQLAAALKYNRYWKMKPFDFVSVFLAALLEYLLFCHNKYSWGGGQFRPILLTAFCTFGALSYIGSLSRIKKQLHAEDLATEKKIQLFNTTAMTCCTIACALHLIFKTTIPLWTLEVFLGCIVTLNLSASMKQLMQSSLLD